MELECNESPLTDNRGSYWKEQPIHREEERYTFIKVSDCPTIHREGSYWKRIKREDV